MSLSKSEKESLTEEVTEFVFLHGGNIIGFADPQHYKKYSPNRSPEKFLSGAKTVILIGIHLVDNFLDIWMEHKSWRGARSFTDEILARIAYQTALFLERKGFRSEVVSYQPGLFLKDTGAIAGTGFIGKNNLLIVPEYGPRIRLRALVTEAPLNCGKPVVENSRCVNCTICIDACPAGALAEGKYFQNLCYPYCQENLEAWAEKAFLWCTICSDVCPVGNPR